MELLNRGYHKVLKLNKNNEVVLTNHFINRVVNRKLQNNIELKIKKIIDIMDKIDDGFYSIKFKDNSTIKMHKYYSKEYNINKIDIITIVKNEIKNEHNDKELYL